MLRRTTRAIGALTLTCLEAGPEDGPLALCLHGFPDTAHTWRHLLPRLAGAGFRAVAPFMRGYAPSEVPADGAYQTGALASDANALHELLGAGPDAVIVGHDWGAFAAYGAAASAPERWRRVVAMSVPPPTAAAGAFLDPEQLKRSFYVFLFQTPMAEILTAHDDLALIGTLWRDWSPGYDAAEDLAHVKDALRDPANLAAAIGYYRAMLQPALHQPRYAAEQAAGAAPPPQPTLYLHGANDGAMGADLCRDAGAVLAEGSRVRILDAAGHFPHLELPDEVNAEILDWIG